MERLREDAGRLSSELRSLERDVGEVGPVEREPERSRRAGSSSPSREPDVAP